MSIGALVSGAPAAGSPSTAARALELSALGFESFEIEFWGGIGADLGALSSSLGALRDTGIRVSSLGVYGNTLDPDGVTLGAVRALIEAAPAFGAPLVSCFAGRLPGASVPASLEAWKAAFGGLADRAAALGLAIALENCRLGDTWKTGKWNIAINPDAWELLFDALPGAPIGLEWEPAHQLLALADPMAQLREWAPRVVHVHGKDASIDRAALARNGFFAATKIGRECLPGEGDTDWREVLHILAEAGYVGCLDLELPAQGAKDPASETARLVASREYCVSISG